MPFDGSGTFNRNRSWAADEAAQIKIRSDYHDSHDGDLANGLSNCITKNGSTQPTADIPMNGKHIVNLANPRDDQPQDAVTKNYVDNFRTFSTSIHLTGADLNGMVMFDSLTGANGLSWKAASGMSFVVRAGKDNETINRWAFNNTEAATVGYDVLNIDERGMINNNGQLSNNLSWDGDTWRTINPGYGALLSYGAGGDFRLSSNDVATITNPFMPTTLHEFFSAQNSAGNALLILNKSDPISGVQKGCYIQGQKTTLPRWLVYLGDATAESATDRVGSDFSIYSYNNLGTVSFREMWIDRDTHRTQFYGEVQSAQTFRSTSATLILAGNTNGSIYFRPNGPTVTSEQSYISTTGDYHMSTDLYVGEAAHASYGSYLGAGQRGKVGSSGSYDAYWHNTYWNGSDVRVYVNTSFIGDIAWQCDYRIKKDIEPIPSTWEAVKQLKPIRYTQRAHDIWVEDDRVRWGFLAHELQEKLFEGAATGIKDGPDIQTANLLAIVAGLTRALQEAMLRIEALEAV